MACNFNTAASTFWIDMEPLASDFGANLGGRAHSRATASAILRDEAAGRGDSGEATAQLVEEIWEESDAFKNQAHLRVMTAGEAAFSHRTATLEPHASMCWVYKVRLSVETMRSALCSRHAGVCSHSAKGRAMRHGG